MDRIIHILDRRIYLSNEGKGKNPFQGLIWGVVSVGRVVVVVTPVVVLKNKKIEKV